MESEPERAEEAGKRGDARRLYEITRKLRSRFQNTCKFALDENLREEKAGFRDGRSCTDQIAADYSGAARRVAVLLAYQLHRFRKGLYSISRDFVEVVAVLWDTCQGGLHHQSSP